MDTGQVEQDVLRPLASAAVLGLLATAGAWWRRRHRSPVDAMSEVALRSGKRQRGMGVLLDEMEGALSLTARSTDLSLNCARVLDTVCHRCAVTLARAEDDCRCCIFVPCDDSGNMLQILCASGFSPEGRRELRVSATDGPAGDAFTRREPVNIEDVTNGYRGWSRQPLSHRNYRSLACVPILMGSRQVVGVLNVDGLTPSLFSEDDMHWLTCVARVCSMAMFWGGIYAVSA